MKVLVVRFSSIGDIVLTTPVIRGLKNTYPEGEVHFVTKKAYTGLLDDNPYVDKIWSLEDDFNALLNDLKKEQFDVLVDLHNNLRTKRLKIGLGIKSYRLNKLNFRKWLLVNLKINRMPDKHIVDRYMDVVKPLNVQPDNRGLDYLLMGLIKLPEGIALPGDYICMAIGGQHETKKMPVDKIIALCRKINRTIVLIGGPEDAPAGEKIASEVGWVRNLCGKLSIRQSALVMRDSAWVISHDTGMMHIAAALGKKVASVWGNTVPAFGMYPYKPHPDSKIFEVEGLSCRPCSKIGHEKCPKGHFKCMNQQNLQEIARTIGGI